jgi:hypothetical protein
MAITIKILVILLFLIMSDSRTATVKAVAVCPEGKVLEEWISTPGTW